MSPRVLFLAKASKNSSFQEPRSVSIHSLVSKLPVAAFPHHSWFHHFILRLRRGQRTLLRSLRKETPSNSPIKGGGLCTQSAWLGVSAESTTFLRYSSGAERSSLGVEMITWPQVSSVSREGTCRSLLMARGLSRDTLGSKSQSSRLCEKQKISNF